MDARLATSEASSWRRNAREWWCEQASADASRHTVCVLQRPRDLASVDRARVVMFLREVLVVVVVAVGCGRPETGRSATDVHRRWASAGVSLALLLLLAHHAHDDATDTTRTRHAQELQEHRQPGYQTQSSQHLLPCSLPHFPA